MEEHLLAFWEVDWHSGVFFSHEGLEEEVDRHWGFVVTQWAAHRAGIDRPSCSGVLPFCLLYPQLQLPKSQLIQLPLAQLPKLLRAAP